MTAATKRPSILDAQPAVVLPLEIAELLNRVYLPANPAKLRSASSEVKAAVIEFKQRLDDARRRNLTTIR